MTTNKATHGTKLLLSWMQASGTTYTALGAGVGVAGHTAYSWMTGRARPRVEMWALIETFTAGAVPAMAWMQPLQDAIQGAND